MVSIIYAGECPNCGLTATFDDYYHTGERIIYCWHCGLSYSKLTAPFESYEETQVGGYGVFSLVDNTGQRGVIALNENLSVEELEELAGVFNAEDTDTSKSYLVIFQDGQFTSLLGELPEEFLLSFKVFNEELDEDKRVLHYILG
ncbi:MAG: hypothetical protein ACQEXB_07970 [Bacillota bacterium]